MNKQQKSLLININILRGTRFIFAVSAMILFLILLGVEGGIKHSNMDLSTGGIYFTIFIILFILTTTVCRLLTPSIKYGKRKYRFKYIRNI